MRHYRNYDSVDKTKLTNAFRALRKLGYFARQNFLCCQSCAWAAVPEDKAERAVFYHSQDNSNLQKYGETYLAWAGDGNEIVRILNENGVQTEWDGSTNQRIKFIL